MVTESYVKMSSEVGVRSRGNGVRNVVGSEELGLRGGIFNGNGNGGGLFDGNGGAAFDGDGNGNGGGVFNGDGNGGGVGVKRELTEEEVRCDTSDIDYYFSNVNLNPCRLSGPGPWAAVGPGLGGIGDRRKPINNDCSENGGCNNIDNNDNNNDNNSLFFKQIGFNGNGNRNGMNGSQNEWNGGVGLPGLGLGTRQKSIAEIIQDDLNHSTSAPMIPSRPDSRNAALEGQFAPLSSSDALRTSGNIQANSLNHNAGVSASLSYASAGGSLSRSTTPDPQIIARSPSPRILAVGEGRGVHSPKALHASSNGPSSTAELVAGLSGMNLSSDPPMDEEKQIRQLFQCRIFDHHDLYNLHGDHNHVKKTSHLDPCEFESFQQPNGSFPTNQNYFLRTDGLVDHHKHGGPNSPSNFHSVGSPSSAIPNYSLSGHSINPALASMMAGHLGGGALPPMFENPTTSAIGVGRTMGASVASRTNLMAAAAKLQNLSRGGHSAGNALQDPLYLHYLTSALNDPSFDGSNSYMDLPTLQKAYLGSLLSPRKSGSSAGVNNGYYGNHAYGISSAYAGSALVSSLLPNSSVGSVSPLLRHGERNMRLPAGMRNLATGFMGNWRSEVGGFMDQSFGCSLLDEFKSNKAKCFELSEIAGHVVEFSADQYGSRFIQQKLETASTEEKNMVFHEIIPQALSLMTDVFGNYVIQKFFEHGTASQIRELADKLTGHVLTLSLQMYGCRVIQKAIEVVDLDQQKKMVVELDGHIMRCVRDQNGNHVIQKCIECIPEDAIQFIISTFYDQVVTLSTHPYGCRVIQRVLEHCHDPTTQRIVMDEIMQSTCMLAQDQYGNYVVQHVLEHGKPHERSAIICKLTGKIVQMSQQKFASNVIEKCLAFGDVIERRTMVNEMLGSIDDNEPLQVMMKDQFANYVVQKVLETCDDQQLEVILSRIKNHLNALKKYTYGKHIVARVEKLVAAGEKRISLQTAYAATLLV